jgi:apolipoprotein N-acyltransferase
MVPNSLEEFSFVLLVFQRKQLSLFQAFRIFSFVLLSFFLSLLWLLSDLLDYFAGQFSISGLDQILLWP